MQKPAPSGQGVLKLDKQYKPIGVHLILEYFGCSFDLLNNYNFILGIATTAVVKSKCQVLKVDGYKFEPQGVTVYVLLAESHLSIHTYPEFGYAAIDVFTCGDKAMPYAAHTYLEQQLKPANINIDEIKRGVA